MNKNLRNSVPGEVVKNQLPFKGERCVLNLNGLMYEYYHDEDLFIVERLSKRIKAELGWFEKISNHAPSVGDFYENLVVSALQEVLPTELKVGSGFVYDSGRRQVSPQIDFIVYDDRLKPLLYRRESFIVVDSSSVISCVEVKKTLNKSILKDILRRYTNINLGTSPMAPRGVQFLNIFTFYSKISFVKIAECVKDFFVSFFDSFESETEENEKVSFIIEHIVLPRLYFFDRTGYISFHCTPADDSSINISMSLNASSLEGHSLGEFLVSVTSRSSEEQRISDKNFLTFPLVMPEKDEIIRLGVKLWVKFPMEDLIELFPSEIHLVRRTENSGNVPYAALISSSIRDLASRKLSNLERSEGFKWLTIDNRLNKVLPKAGLM